MNKFLGFLFASLSLSIVGAATGDEQSDIEARIAEMEAFAKPVGTWEGQFRVVSAPQSLLDSIARNDPENKGIKIRIHLSDDSDPELFLWYAGDNDWTEMRGRSETRNNLFGWTVFVLQYSGQWIEKYNITFDQLQSEEAAITFTRTVHNWYMPEQTDEYVDFYHMFGHGRVEKRVSRQSD